MDDLSKELRAMIEANLPKVHVDALQARLSKVMELERNNDVLIKSEIRLNAELDNFRAAEAGVKEAARQTADRQTELAKREKSLAERELKCAVAEIRIEAANEKAKAIYDLASIVFRNPRLVSSESTTRQVAMPTGGYLQSANDSKFTTTEEQ